MKNKPNAYFLGEAQNYIYSTILPEFILPDYKKGKQSNNGLRKEQQQQQQFLATELAKQTNGTYCKEKLHNSAVQEGLTPGLCWL